MTSINEEAYKNIISRLDKIDNKVENNMLPSNKEWIDTQEVCEMLHISKRTLQNYRDRGLIPYSSIDGKMYYRYRDILNILESNYVPSRKSNERRRTERAA